MKRVTLYETTDNCRFNTKKEATHHETMLEDVEAAIRLLFPIQLDTMAFANGEGYIQLSKETVTEYYSRYEDHLEKFAPHCVDTYKINPKGIIGRVLEDNKLPAIKLWEMSNRIDSKNRLWEQTYYAKNPDQGVNKRLNVAAHRITRRSK